MICYGFRVYHDAFNRALTMTGVNWEPLRPKRPAMLIRCPTCCRGYDLPPEVLGGPGRVLRCAECRESWTLAEGYDAPEIVAEARSARRLPAARPATRAPRRPGPPGLVRRATAGLLRTGLILAPLAAGMAGIACKDRVVRLVPQTAALFQRIGLPVNLRGLALADVHGTLGSEPGVTAPVLLLEGRIDNLRHASTRVPDLRIAVRDKTGNELYSWTTPAPKPRLSAGETIVFRTRLAAPPPDGQEFVVGFADPAGPPGATRSVDDKPPADPRPLR